MKKMILAALMLFMANMPMLAYDFIENGFAFNILKDGTLALTNKVKGFSFDKAMDPALAYKGAVVVPASVTHSGKKYSVSTIGRNAFYDCRAVTSVNVSEGITKIDMDAFYYCSMASLTLPASVTKLVPGFLHQCPKLSSITISPQNKYYKSQGNCIYNKTMTQLIFVSPVLKMYKFPASVRSVTDYAFTGSKIKKLVIPSTLTHIGGQSFYSSNISDIVCDRHLKKLQGSEDFMAGCPLPIWAMDPAAIVNVADSKKSQEVRPNTTTGRISHNFVMKTDGNGTVHFMGKGQAGTYEPNTRYICGIYAIVLKDLDSPTAGLNNLKSREQIRFSGVNSKAE